MPKIISNKSNVDLDYPICRPSLDLDFTQEVLDPRITFSRGSIGTRVNRNRLIETVSANTPRFDYDPVTGECKGLLIEESRTNLISSSNSFGIGNIYYGVTASAAVSPDGTTNASKIFETLINSYKIHSFNFTAVAGTTYCASAFVKAGERKTMYFKLTQSGDAVNNAFSFNMNTGAFTASGTTRGAIYYGNGWWRVYATFTPTVTSCQLQLFLRNDTSGALTYQGDGSSGFYAYGGQVEAGAFPTSYIPTTGSTVTRSADNASMTGTNFSSWYNQSEGTIYTNNRIPYTPNPNVSLFFTITNPSPFSRHTVEQTTANGLTYINQNGSGIQYWSTSGSGVFPANTNRKTTYSYSSSNNITILSGTSNQTYNFGQISRTDVNKSMTGLYFGVFINSLYLNGTIARFTYYPKKLKDNQLLYLTQ